MTTKFPKVTVLMGTYNRPDYLREAIASVVNQSMEDWELLVMNDGGVDVDYVISEFQDGRIRYFNDEVNRGLAVRLNFGLKEACGEYIAYLGDDDIYYPNHLGVLSNALDENPAIGAVYSDLYAVQFIKDETNGKRYPLHKLIQVARDYNRDFMFHFNHTLHVSLMHRKDMALMVGGYDENITVLIDWNITRKLTFYIDFKYIPVLTGEYYIPINKSDRISHLERENNEKFKHNLRKIKADLPPEPWPKVDRIAVIFPVNEWSDSVTEIITSLTDKLCYPVKFIIVNNDRDKVESDCRQALGKIGELKNIFIHTPPKPLTELEAYRFGAKKVEADYVYLPSKRVDTKLEMRLIFARHHLKRMECEGIKWGVEQEIGGPFDILMGKELFLRRSDPEKGNMEAVIDVISGAPPESLRSDFFMIQAKKQHRDGNYKLAYQFIKNAETVKKGGAGEQFLIDLYSRICFDLKKYDEAEEKCRALIERGYGADNWIRLGRILQIEEKFDEAILAYKKGLEEIGLKEADLNSSVFPISVPEDFGSFTALIGLGECLLETGNLTESSKMFRRAAKLKANSHRPFLGFGKLFIETGELDRAEEALITAVKKNEKLIATNEDNSSTTFLAKEEERELLGMRDPEVYHWLGVLYEKKKLFDVAFDCHLKAFELDKTDSRKFDSIYKVGAVLERWGDIKRLSEEFLEHRPGHVPAMTRLSSIYYTLGEYQKAEDMAEQGLTFDPENEELRKIYLKIRQADENPPLPPFMKGGIR
ncbi:MAG: glycosyltransferase [Proteobacteria bacterium]|nr:glycosyltransferase [Pseudomonadota bacterium]